MRKELFPINLIKIKAGESGSAENPIIIDTEEKLLEFFGTPVDSYEGVMLRPNSLSIWSGRNND